jgi:hypothetical protein
MCIVRRKISKIARLRRENVYQGVDFIGRKIIYLEHLYLLRASFDHELPFSPLLFLGGD